MNFFSSIKKVKSPAIDWNFPPNLGGQEEGLNNPGIETFNGKQSEALCKEILQNSLDAHTSFPVTVKFDLLELEKNIIPGIDSLNNVFNKLDEYWGNGNNEKSKKFIDLGKSILKQSKIKVLKVSDFNTTGLTGSEQSRGGNFNNLVKSSGVSEKNPLAGGSFGIGKNAPFACSYLRTVLYSTLDKDGIYAFQGVARLATHRDSEGNDTQGTGFYGITEKSKPLIGSDNIPNFFRRKEIGTDLYVVGFRDNDDDWKKSIIVSSIKSFFMAILNNKLVVEVGNETIDSETIESHILDNFSNSNENDFTREYFDSVVSKGDENTKYFEEENFENLGKVSLYLKKNKDFSKKIAYVRGTGMKILDKGNFRTAFQFAGVVFFQGQELNKLIRTLENPSHDKLQSEHLEKSEKRIADKTLKSIQKWISTKINEFTSVDDNEELEIEGISHFLPDSNYESKTLKEEGSIRIKDIVIKEVKPSKAKVNTESVSELELPPDKEINDSDDDEYGFTEPTDLEGETEKPPVSHGSTDNPPPTTNGNDSGNSSSPIPKIKHVSNNDIIKNRVILCDYDGKEYRAIITPKESKEYYLSFKIKYEVGSEDRIPERVIFQKKELSKNGIFFGPVKLEGNISNQLQLSFDESIISLLEVLVYAE